MDKVDEFIYNIKSGERYKEIEELFLQGGCYYFAKLLANKFYGEVWYLPVDNHFVTLIDGTLYDIGGKVLKGIEVLYNWDYYQRIEPEDAKRVTKNCIEAINA